MSLMQIGRNTLIAVLIGWAAFGATPLICAEPDPIERCRQASTDQERIACLEEALRALQPQSEKAEVAAERPQSPQPPPSSSAPPDSSQTVELGADQVSARDARGQATEPLPRLNAAVQSAQVIPYKRLQVTLDNGQVWRQIRGETQRINARDANDQTVEIWQSNIGGYRMRLNEMARTIRVERIR